MPNLFKPSPLAKASLLTPSILVIYHTVLAADLPAVSCSTLMVVGLRLHIQPRYLTKSPR
jgi:hypothetical protein